MGISNSVRSKEKDLIGCFALFSWNGRRDEVRESRIPAREECLEMRIVEPFFDRLGRGEEDMQKKEYSFEV